MVTTTPTSTIAIPAFITDWFAALQPRPLAEMIPQPEHAAIFSADMIVGFCSRGALASDRVGALAQPVRDLFVRAYEHGVRRFVLAQDTHDPATPEFQAWPVHCVRGSEESQTIPELTSLPFRSLFTIIEKNSLDPGYGTNFDAWLDQNADLTHAMVVGNCTDLCVYNMAMHLRLRANALNRSPFEVIVPANAVETYDLPPEEAARIGAMAHPGDFFHQVFLYHMALNGIRVVRELC